MLNVVKAILKIRRENEALQINENLEVLYAKENERVFAYRRGNLLMMCNPSGKEAVIEVSAFSQSRELTKEPMLLTSAEKLYEIGTATCSDGRYSLGAQSFAIWQI